MNPKMIVKNKKGIEVLYLLVAAFVIVMLASRSSFLYPLNDWNDANSYFSVGKALFHGKMPYRDIFDQKGMYLYFFYGLAYLISHTTFLGVFWLEWICAVADLLAIERILKLYLYEYEYTALILTPLPLALSFASQSFYYGGSAEELCLPYLFWGLYLFLRYFVKDYPVRKMSNKTLLVAGVLAGMIANIKFTSLGFFFAFMMCIAFSFLALKDFSGAVKACLVFLAGMALPFLPWLFYFGMQHSLYEYYYGYVYINVFSYSNLNEAGPGLLERCYLLAKLLYWVIRKNLCYFLFVIPGALFAIVAGNEKGEHRKLPIFGIFSICFFLFLGIYVGGSELPYYALPLCIFAPLGIALLGRLLPLNHLLLGGGIVLAICMALIYQLSMNTPFMQQKKEDHFLYQLRSVIEKEENPTLLNIGCLDAGLYTVCDIVPTCRWFQTQTINDDMVYREQERYIEEGQTQFVLARNTYPEVIFEKYELAVETSWEENGQKFTYYLFKRK